MIKKIDLQKLIYILSIIVIVGIPGIKFISYGLYLSGIVENTFVVNQVYLLWILVPVLLITYVYGLTMDKYKFKYTDILIYLLIIFALVSTYFAVDIEKSILGEYRRNEGLFSLLNYYLLFLNVKNLEIKKYKNNIIKLILMVGIFQVIYSFFQVYTEFPFIQHFSMPYMAMGLCGNPNFFGSYMVMLLLISIVLYLLDKERKYLYLTMIYFLGLCLASSTGPFIGFVLAFILLLVWLHKKIKLKQAIKLILILSLLYFCIEISVKLVQEEIFGNEIGDNYNITKELTGSITNYKQGVLGNGRVFVWKRSIPVAKQYWLTGAGLDNFGLVYPQIGNMYFDKAHNVYLQILITNGLFPLITYCLLCLIIFIKGFKFKNATTIALFASFIGYSIQAFANISVIDVAPIFFIVLALLHTSQ